MSLSNKKNKAVFQSIHQPSIVEQIIDTFKEAILNGELRPGQRLPSELDLAEQLGVGRSAIREAMKIMEALGVVTIKQGSGTFIVDKPSPKMLNPLVFAIMLEAGMAMDFYELRYSTQVSYCELAAQKATAEDWERIQHAAEALEAFIQKSGFDRTEFCNLDLDFHVAIMEATHNPLILRIGRTVEELFFTSIHISLSGSGNVVNHHRLIMEAMRDGSPLKIRDAVAHSIQYWKEELETHSTDE